MFTDLKFQIKILTNQQLYAIQTYLYLPYMNTYTLKKLRSLQIINHISHEHVKRKKVHTLNEKKKIFNNVQKVKKTSFE